MPFTARQLVLAGLIAALTAVSAFLHIPLPLVPITLQTLVLVCGANLLPPAPAVLSQIGYLMIGLLGLPVFAGGGGLSSVLSPSFGYLLAFPLAAWIISRGQRSLAKTASFFSSWAINFLGLLSILLIGALWLVLVVPIFIDQPISFRTALLSGVIVFLPGEILKAFLATGLMNKLRSVQGEE